MTHNTYNLDEAMSKAERRPIDASWSPAKKRAVAIACVAVAAGAVGAGAWGMMRDSTPKLPTTAKQALATVSSAQFARLDAGRKQQYLTESWRLIRELPEEQRREFMRDEKNREMFRALMEEQFDDMAKRFARGESMQDMWRGMGPPGGQRPERPPEGQRPQLTEEERAQRAEEFRNRMNERMAKAVQSGNAQSGGLRGEMMKRGGGGRGAGGWGGRGGGGGGGGARPAGGGGGGGRTGG